MSRLVSPPLLIAVLALALLLIGPLLAQVRLAPPLVASGLFALGGVIGLIAAIAALWTILARREGAGWLALGIGAAAVVVVFIGVLPAIRQPRLNDVATDAVNPPHFVKAPTLPDNAGRNFSYSPKRAAVVAQAYPEVRPLHSTLTPARIYAVALETARDQPGWSVSATDETSGTFEVVTETRLFHFRDDVVIRVSADGGGARVDMRSKSRLGRGDLGANAKRIRGYFEQLGARLQ